MPDKQHDEPRTIPSIVHLDSGCWLWTRHTNKGYGVFSTKRDRYRSVHAVFWEEFNGPIPDGLVLDHLCRNRWCVNPSHLEPVTTRENILRGVGLTAAYARRTHCARGHLLVKGKRRGRICLEC